MLMARNHRKLVCQRWLTILRRSTMILIMSSTMILLRSNTTSLVSGTRTFGPKTSNMSYWHLLPLLGSPSNLSLLHSFAYHVAHKTWTDVDVGVIILVYNLSVFSFQVFILVYIYLTVFYFLFHSRECVLLYITHGKKIDALIHPPAHLDWYGIQILLSIFSHNF
jgi:hypothetical protein